MNPLVSIITPLFNRLDLVPETWHSILAQSYLNWEWIVVDDGSTDGSDIYLKEISQRDSRVQLHYREGLPKGPSRCRNKGFEKATGNYILFLDSDDIISSTCLEKRVSFLEQNQHLDFAVFTQATFQNEITSNQPLFTKFFSDKDDYLSAFIADQHPWQTSGPLWKKESFFKTGGFREDYTIMEDPELHIRALLMGLKFEVVNTEPDFFYRLLAKNEEQTKLFWHNSIIGRIRFYQDLYPQLKSDEQKKTLKQGIIILYKTFLLARIVQYKSENKAFLKWLKQHQLISPQNHIKIQLYNILSKPVLNNIPFLKGLLFYLFK